MKLLTWLVVLALAASGVRAQDPPAKSPQPYIRTSAEAVVSAKPDRAKINIGVTTQAPAAQAAAAQNAKELDAIIRQIRSALGLKIVCVISAEESGGIIRPMAAQMMRAEGAPTPVESGTIEVHGNITLTVEVAQ